jgi:cytoplasmic iron level regulating protein YaaA (DUF328/UPF0246 family)
MPDFTILMPPAERKQSGGNPLAPDMFDIRSGGTFNYFRELNPERKKLIAALETFSRDGGDQREAVFGVKGDMLAQAIEDNTSLAGAPLMAALERYSPGVMYQSMDFSGLPTGAQRRLLEHTIILSGLYGLLRPDDLIPSYRLKMDASLPDTGKVSAFWRPHVSTVLDRLLAGRVVWNLLPGAHQDAWDEGHTYAHQFRVQFVREKGGERKSVSHGVKQLRGQLINFVVRETVDSLEGLREWRAPDGYRLDEQATQTDADAKTTTLVYVRKG